MVLQSKHSVTNVRARPLKQYTSPVYYVPFQETVMLFFFQGDVCAWERCWPRQKYFCVLQCCCRDFHLCFQMISQILPLNQLSDYCSAHNHTKSEPFPDKPVLCSFIFSIIALSDMKNHILIDLYYGQETNIEINHILCIEWQKDICTCIMLFCLVEVELIENQASKTNCMNKTFL